MNLEMERGIYTDKGATE